MPQPSQRVGARDYSQYRRLACQRQSFIGSLHAWQPRNRKPAVAFTYFIRRPAGKAEGDSVEAAVRHHAHVPGDIDGRDLPSVPSHALDTDAYLAGPPEKASLV